MRMRLPLNVTREKSRHGKVVYYYRVDKGPRIRLPDIGSESFNAAYTAAFEGRGVIAPHNVREGTIAHLVAAYKQSLHYRKLTPQTQRTREQFFRYMVEKSGDRAISKVTEQTIIDARDKRTGGKGHAANNFLKAVRPLFAFAKERGWVASDPAKNVPLVKTIKGHFRAWSIEDVQKFEARHPLGTMANLAMRVLLFTGLRRSDAILLGKQHIKHGVLHYTPGKTEGSSGVAVTFTVLPPLAEAIKATKTGDLTLIVSKEGIPFGHGSSFGNWFRARCKEAGVPGTPHGLRKTGPAMAAEAGASAKELMAMWGWTTMAQATLYTMSADRKRLGNTAAVKLLEGYNENNIPRT